MLRKIPNLLLAFLFTLALPLQIRSEDISLDWERARLSSEMEKKIADALSAIVSRSHFLVTVEIRQKEEKKKQAFKEDGQDTDSSGLVPLTKLGVWADPEKILKDVNNQKDSIFDYIGTVVVDIAIDSNVDAKVDESVKSIAKKVLGTYGKFSSQIKINRFEMIAGLNSEKRSWQTWLLELKLPIGLILATLILFVFGLLIARWFYRLELRKVGIMENSAQHTAPVATPQAVPAQGEPSHEESNKHRDVMPQVYAQPGAVVDGIQTQKGLDYFKQMAVKEPQKSASLIKQWLNSTSPSSVEVLSIIPRVCPIEMLVPIFSHLDDEARRNWKKLLNEPIREGAFARADSFILTQTVDSFLVPSMPIEDDVKDLVSTMNAEEIFSCAKKSPELGALLANILNTIQVARMFSMLPRESTDAIVRESLQFDFSKIAPLTQSLKATVNDLRKQKKIVSIPFLDKSVDLIRELGPEREGEIFAAISQAGEFDLLERATKQFFPAELLLKLPVEILKTSLNKLSMATRTELIASQSGESRKVLLACMGESGKLREMMDFQIQQAENDPVQKRRLERNRDQIWKSFVGVAREHIKSDDLAMEAAQDVLNKWLEDLKQQGGNSEPKAA